MKDPKKVATGKKNRASGAQFELQVRKDLEEKGWIVDKFSLNIEFTEPTEEAIVKARQKDYTIDNMMKYKYIEPSKTGKLIQAKNKWAGPGRPMMMSAGFPDFLAFRNIDSGIVYMNKYTKMQEVIGVEVKTNGYLKPEEKEKCKWLLENNIFSKILIAEKTKVKNKVVIVYHDFTKKYGKK